MNAVAILRHKRVANARPKLPKSVLISAPIAGLATVAAVGAGVLVSSPDATSTSDFTAASGDISAVATREAEVNRSASRGETEKEQEAAAEAIVERHREYQQELAAEKARQEAREARIAAREARIAAREEAEATAEAVAAADTELWTTEVLNLWSLSGNDAEELGEVDAGEQVLVTGRERDGRTEIVVDGESRWVTSGYLEEEKPEPEAAKAPAELGVGGECTNGTSVSPGVSPNIVKVHQAVCANFPEITTYGDFRGDGEHAQGIAVDIMVSGDRGWEVANFLQSHVSELGINYLIYSQQIWSVERSGEGWRGMEDRGSTTANHYDHVHVTTY
jgi:hypothetical protein